MRKRIGLAGSCTSYDQERTSNAALSVLHCPSLLDIQFAGEFPLLRTTALQALPAPLRADMVARSNRLAYRFAGTIVEGMSEGSVRIVDPLIASQLIMATINTAYDLKKWALGLPPETAVALYASTLVDGIFNDRVLETTRAPDGEKRSRAGRTRSKAGAS